MEQYGPVMHLIEIFIYYWFEEVDVGVGHYTRWQAW